MPGGAYTQHKEAADNVSSPEHCEQVAAWPLRKTEFAISLKECMFQSTVAPSTEGVIKKDFIGFAVLSSSLVPLKREVSNHNGIFDERAETHP